MNWLWVIPFISGLVCVHIACAVRHHYEGYEVNPWVVSATVLLILSFFMMITIMCAKE
jgi:hypothetical protein